jgi:hypothetical protein
MACESTISFDTPVQEWFEMQPDHTARDDLFDMYGDMLVESGVHTLGMLLKVRPHMTSVPRVKRFNSLINDRHARLLIKWLNVARRQINTPPNDYMSPQAIMELCVSTDETTCEIPDASNISEDMPE